MLERMAQRNPGNVNVICDYITAEQNELNIKESTKEGKIKCLLALANRLKDKSFRELSKEDILDYLTNLKKPVTIDPKHKSIGTYNGRQMILLKFFRWLYNPDESDGRKRVTPPCMNGVKRLPRQEKSPYKPSDLWTQEEHEIFLRYCPSVRDKAFHAMAYDTSARPHELLNLKIGDIVFKKTTDDVQYAEILVTGKTKSRTLPLISSLPYVKEWIQAHPHGTNSSSWLFISYCKQNNLGQITRDGLLKRYGQYYRKRYFPKLVKEPTVPERDKAYLKNLFTKPWNLYIFRHSALTEKSQILKEHTLRDHAGWSTSSKMPDVYIHYFGTESSTSLLEAYGITKHKAAKMDLLRPQQCPNCHESNKPNERFCITCKMVLKYKSYEETIGEEKNKKSEIQLLQEQHRKEMMEMREEIRGQLAEVFKWLKPEIMEEGLI
jgi:integrase